MIDEDMDTPAAIIRRLTAEIEMLDAALLARGAHVRPSYQPWMLGMTHQERALMGALIGAYPDIITRDELLVLVPSPGRDEEDRQPEIVGVLVHRCRKKLGHDALVNHRGSGYALSPAFYEGLPKKMLDAA